EQRRPPRAGTAFAIAPPTKLTPALMTPYYLRRRAWAFLAAPSVTGAILSAPFLVAGSPLATGLATYARHWEFNSAAYHLLRHVVASELTIRRILALVLFFA